MLVILVLVLLLVVFTLLVIYNPWNISFAKEDYSYLEPEDEKRTQLRDDATSLHGCGCGALSPFEIPYYMNGSQCSIRTSDQYPGDPGYFLGRSVI